jgi:hypothetical protein
MMSGPMQKRLQGTGRAVNRFRRVLLLVVLFAAGCSDPFGPRFWNATPQSVTVFSASRPEYVGLVSAVDVANDPIQAISIEAPGATGNWDFVLVDRAGGGLALVPAGALDGVTSRARIAVIEGAAFLDIREAPRDTALYSADAVALRPGVVYVIRTRRAACGFGSGSFYAKMQPLEIDEARGVFRAAIVRNPICDDRSLVPPEQ